MKPKTETGWSEAEMRKEIGDLRNRVYELNKMLWEIQQKIQDYFVRQR